MTFDPNDDADYRAWKTDKLDNYPATLGELLVEIRDPFAMTGAEISGILSRCARTNMALYRLERPEAVRENPLPAITAQLGLSELDHNLGADADGLSALTPGGSSHAPFAHYIPYREAAIGWHTDGYYNPADHQVQALCLYCARPAHAGGENELLDHDLIYIRLRDEAPELLHALMAPEAMTIPPRLDEQGAVARPERSGPVFSFTPAGALHMRFTNRTRSIRWRDDATTLRALEAMRALLNTPSPYHFRGRLESGWGLISNNVPHTRNAFSDPQGSERRILYRARYFDRLPATA